jgi:hypothetical protein
MTQGMAHAQTASVITLTAKHDLLSCLSIIFMVGISRGIDLTGV